MRVKNLTEYGVGQWGALVVVGAAGETELAMERRRRKILGKDEPGLQRGVLGGQVAEKAPQADQVYAARAIGQGRVLLAQAAEPAEQMRVTSQLG
jgi:hypothetical protein